MRGGSKMTFPVMKLLCQILIMCTKTLAAAIIKDQKSLDLCLGSLDENFKRLSQQKENE